MTDVDLAPLIRRTNELLTVLAKAQLEPLVKEETQSPQRRELYRLTGRSLSVKQLSTKVGLSVGTISTIWQRWENLGLLIKDGQRYRRVLP
jgi:hypothetical protein